MDSTTPASAPAYVTSVRVIAIKGCLKNSFFGARVPAEEAVLTESVAP
jgi:hypothetical protein